MTLKLHILRQIIGVDLCDKFELEQFARNILIFFKSPILALFWLNFGHLANFDTP